MDRRECEGGRAQPTAGTSGVCNQGRVLHKQGWVVHKRGHTLMNEGGEGGWMRTRGWARERQGAPAAMTAAAAGECQQEQQQLWQQLHHPGPLTSCNEWRMSIDVHTGFARLH